MRMITASLTGAAGLVFLTLAATGATADVTPAKKVPNELVVTRADGSAFTFTKQLAWCLPHEADPKTMMIYLGTPAPEGDEDSPPTKPWLNVEAVAAEVKKGLTVQLPFGHVWDKPEGATLFIYDPKIPTPYGDGGNELNSDGEDSTGTLYLKGTCTPKPKLTLRAKAFIDSEFGDAPGVRIRGTLTSVGVADTG